MSFKIILRMCTKTFIKDHQEEFDKRATLAANYKTVIFDQRMKHQIEIENAIKAATARGDCKCRYFANFSFWVDRKNLSKAIFNEIMILDKTFRSEGITVESTDSRGDSHERTSTDIETFCHFAKVSYRHVMSFEWRFK